MCGPAWQCDTGVPHAEELHRAAAAVAAAAATNPLGPRWRTGAREEEADLPNPQPPPTPPDQPSECATCFDCGVDADGDRGEEWLVPDDEWGLTRGRTEYTRGRLCLPCAAAWRKERAEAGLPESEDCPV